MTLTAISLDAQWALAVNALTCKSKRPLCNLLCDPFARGRYRLQAPDLCKYFEQNDLDVIVLDSLLKEARTSLLDIQKILA